MELWQMDVVGGVKIENASECSAVTGLDDHSRFCTSAKAVARATAKPVSVSDPSAQVGSQPKCLRVGLTR